MDLCELFQANPFAVQFLMCIESRLRIHHFGSTLVSRSQAPFNIAPSKRRENRCGGPYQNKEWTSPRSCALEVSLLLILSNLMQFLTLPVVTLAHTLPTFVPSITHFKIGVLTCRACQSPSHTQFWRGLRVIHLPNGKSRMFVRSWTRLSKSCIPCICTRMTQGMTRNLDRFGYRTLCRGNNSFIDDPLTLPLLMAYNAMAKKCGQKPPVFKNSKQNYPRFLAKVLPDNHASLSPINQLVQEPASGKTASIALRGVISCLPRSRLIIHILVSPQPQRVSLRPECDSI